MRNSKSNKKPRNWLTNESPVNKETLDDSRGGEKGASKPMFDLDIKVRLLRYIYGRLAHKTIRQQ